MAFNTVDIMGNYLTKFACVACKREYLPSTEFSEAQLEKCAAQEIQNSAEHTIRLLQATCKACSLEVKNAETEKAAERAAEAATIAAESTWEAVSLALPSRPFGMTPLNSAEAATVGYRVVKVTEGKPAWAEGIRPGWVLVAVGESDVREMPLNQVQAMLKETPLPVQTTFEQPPPDWHFCVSCCGSRPPQAYSRKMLTKPVSSHASCQCLPKRHHVCPRMLTWRCACSCAEMPDWLVNTHWCPFLYQCSCVHLQLHS